MNETDRTLRVSFDGRSIEYDVTELDELVHAYATTIHKAQGSEYPIRLLEKKFKDFDNCICLTYEGYSLEIMDILIRKVFSLCNRCPV